MTPNLDDDLAAAVRYTARLRTGFYFVVLLVALAGQVTGAVERLHLPWYVAAPAVGALELGGMVVLSNADVRRRLGERAVASRLLSAGIAAFAVAFNWMCHGDHLLGGFFAGMSALGYLVWLMSTENNRRDRLRAAGMLPPAAPLYGWWRWLRRPAQTAAARSLALARGLGLYASLEAVQAAKRAEQDAARQQRRQAAIADVLRRKVAASTDRQTAEIAVTVYDMDRIAAELAATADYAGLTAVIAGDLVPDRLLGSVHGNRPEDRRDGRPATTLSWAQVPPAVLDEVRAELPSTEPVKSDPHRTATSPRKSTGRKRERRAGSSTRRSADETRELAAQLRVDQPGISKAEVARLLGISTARLRQVEKPINGTEVPAH